MGTVITSDNRKMRGNALSKRKSIILLGSYPPPFGGIPTFNQTLFSHLKPWGALIWAKSSQNLQDPQATPLDSNPVRMVQNLIRDAKKAIILDSSFFFLEAPNKILILIFLLLKPFLKFRFIKILHSGRTQSLHSKFSFIKKIFFRCSLFLIDEYITVNRNLYDWLADDIKVKRDITIIPSLLPLPEKIFSENLDPGIQKELSRYSHLITSIGLFVPNYGLFASDPLYSIEFNRIKRIRENVRNKSNRPPSLYNSLRSLVKTILPDEFYKNLVMIADSLRGAKEPGESKSRLTKSFRENHTTADFFYRTNSLENALDLLAICSTTEKPFNSKRLI